MKYIFILLIFTVFTSCNFKPKPVVSEDLIGSWNLFHIYNDNKDILRNHEKDVIMTSLLAIDRSGKFLIDVDLDGETTVQGDIISNDFNEKGRVAIVTNATDELFNGTYSVTIWIEGKGSKFKTFHLKLESDNLLLIAEKNDLNINI